jgi:hypothetical protein
MLPTPSFRYFRCRHESAIPLLPAFPMPLPAADIFFIARQLTYFRRMLMPRRHSFLLRLRPDRHELAELRFHCFDH